MDPLAEEFMEFDHPFENMRLDDTYCFLCGVELGEGATQEDIFPRWLQRKHNLWNKHITLINGTLIRYAQLKIPCCFPCNNEYLSQLEKEISTAINKGYRACLELDSITIFYWSAKILYGILRKGLNLLVDRSSPEKGSIIPEKLIQTYDDLHTFMQGIRRSMNFIGPLPFSVLVANLHDLGARQNYFFRDNIISQTFSIRSGEVGIIVAMADAGINNKSYSRYLDEVNGRKLHPIQFDELFAKVTYESHRLKKAPFFTVVSNKDKSVPIDVITQLPTGMILKDWDQEEYSHWLGSVMAIWGIPEDSLFVPPNLVQTFLSNEDGTLKLLDQEGNLVN